MIIIFLNQLILILINHLNEKNSCEKISLRNKNEYFLNHNFNKTD